MRPALVMIAVAALVAPLVPAGAQQIRGEVLLPDSATRAVGVVVIATDEQGGVAGRALTSDRGEFFIKLPRAGQFGLRLLRLGFRPTLVPPVAIAEGETHTVRVVLGAQSVSLAAVRVRGDRVCRIREDSGQAVARVWEQVRTALSATQLTEAGKAVHATIRRYERTLDRTGDTVRREVATVKEGTTTHPFQSVSTDSLARAGYIVSEGGEFTYYAPDPDVLMSDPFAALHCFHVEPPPRDHAGWIGIGFQPARERNGVNDIEGTLWLDRESAVLQRLDFTYTNLPWNVPAAIPGGFVNFRRLADGQWIIPDWVIRLPRLQVQRERDGMKVEVLALQMVGGEVIEAAMNGVVLHRASAAPVEMALVSRDATLTGEGARVELVGTPFKATADATGVAHFDRVLPGVYVARYSAAIMQRLGAKPIERVVRVGGNAAANTISLRLPTIDELLADLCGSMISSGKDAMMFGSLGAADPHAFAGTTITASWPRDFKPGARDSEGVSYKVENRELDTDDSGNWRLCGVPAGTPVTLKIVARNVLYTTVKVRVPEKWRIARFELPDTAAKAP